MVIDRMHVAHTILHELVVRFAPQWRPFLDPCGHDPFIGPGKKRKRGGAVTASEIDAVVESTAKNREKIFKVGQAPAHHDGFVHARDRGQKRNDFGGDGERDMRVGKLLTERRYCRRSQDQIADALQLEEENVQRHLL